MSIRVRIASLPTPPIRCGIPFTVRACVFTDKAGTVTIGASVSGEHCHVASGAGPAPGPLAPTGQSVIVRAFEEACTDLSLTVECPGHDGVHIVTLTITATNSAGETESDHRVIQITCP